MFGLINILILQKKRMKTNQTENVCRSCMSENTELVSIFRYDEFSKTKYTHADMLMAFTSVQISSGDGLPELVCLECVDHINKCYLFKLKCENSDKLLRKNITQVDANPCFNATDYLTIKTEEAELIKQECDFYDNDNDDYISNNESFSEEKFDEILAKTDRKNKIVTKKKRTRKFFDKNDNSCSTKKCRFKCDICRKCFLYERCLIKHTKKLHNLSIESRRCLKKSFLKSQNRARTIKKASSEEENQEKNKTDAIYGCDKCKSRFNEEDKLLQHINEKHVCTICRKKVRHLNIHLRSHTGEKAYLCALCGKGFSQQAGYSEHMLRHSGIRSFTCDICEMSFITKGALVSHSIKHSVEKIYQCDSCVAVFHRPRSLKQHKKFIHGTKDKHECDICHQTFGYLRSLRRHKVIHTGVKPYSCNFCEKTFTQKTTLTSHIRVHTGERPYFCKACGQSFGQRCSLRSHKIKENH